MRATRTLITGRLLLLLLLLLVTSLGTAACGTSTGAASAEAPEPDAPTEAAGASPSAPAAALESADAVTEGPPIGEVFSVEGFPEFDPAPTFFELVEDRGDTIVVRHAMGETELPKDPARWYVDSSMLMTAFFLDLPVVGGEHYNDMVKLPSWEENSAGAELFEATYTYNFEHMLAMEPDASLAFANIVYAEDGDETYANASAVAPTIVAMGSSPVSYFEASVRDLAVALGRDRDEVEAKLLAERNRVIEGCTPLQEAIGDETVALIGVWAGAPFLNGPGYMVDDRYVPNTDAYWLYGLCGLKPAANLRDLVGENGSLDNMSLEIFPTIDADHIFIYSGGYDAEGREAAAAYLDELLANPVWQSLPAAQNGNAYVMEYFSAYDFDSATEAIRSATEALEAAD